MEERPWPTDPEIWYLEEDVIHLPQEFLDTVVILSQGLQVASQPLFLIQNLAQRLLLGYLYISQYLRLPLLQHL